MATNMASQKPVTPLEKYPDLGKAMGLSVDLYFKREDLHPYGSHKGRSIPVMMDHYVAAGDSRFAISSSGNAGLAAALHAKGLNAGRPEDPISLDVFIGQKAVEYKADRLKELADDNIRVLIKERPLQAVTMAANEGVRSLRQSTDDVALRGYESLVEEVSVLKKVGAVFIGTSSGTTAQALAARFPTHAVQTSSCHPIVDAFETYDGPDEPSIADAISDITVVRKLVLVPLMKKSGGRGWVVTNEEIEAAQDMVAEHCDGLEISTNSALSVAAAIKAASIGVEFDGPVVCMICGE
jgi:threonine synthase